MNVNISRSLVLLLFIVATSIVIGLSYGNSNQNTYLIHGLTQINPNFLSGDWFAHGTLHYHDQFSNIIIFINYLGLPIDISLIAIEVVLRIVALIAIYKIVYIIAHNYAFMSFMVVLVFLILERTTSVAGSYIFSTMLQPSSFGSAFSLIGFLFFIRSRYFIAGICIAIAGYMHTNFLLLGFVYLGIAHILLGFEGIVKRITFQFLPMLFVLAMKMPFLLGMLSAENGEMATHIFQFIRSPHHYVPSYYLFDFLLFAGWSLLGLASLYLLDVEDALKKRIVSLYGALLIVIVVSTLLTTVVFIPIVSKLFFWRMAPFSVLLSQILFVSAVAIQAFPSRRESVSYYKIACFFLLSGCLLIFRWYSYKYGLISNKTLLLAGAIFICCVLFLRNTIAAIINPIFLTKNALEIACIAVLSISLTYEFSSSFYRNSTLLNGYPKDTESELYQWVKTTKQTASFLIPPELQNFRLHGERSIIADWKSTPVDPAGLIEWYNRIKDITGLINVKSSMHASNAYHYIDIDRLTFLKKKYGISYAVLYFNKNEINGRLPEVFRNSEFIVISLASL